MNQWPDVALNCPLLSNRDKKELEDIQTEELYERFGTCTNTIIVRGVKLRCSRVFGHLGKHQQSSCDAGVEWKNEDDV